MTDTITERLKVLERDLEYIARLGSPDGEHGNSNGNVMAIAALKTLTSIQTAISSAETDAGMLYSQMVNVEKHTLEPRTASLPILTAALLKAGEGNVLPLNGLPTVKGFYWAKWVKIEGGEPDDYLTGKPEVVEVFENCIDEKDDEFLRVFVTGFSKSQSPENFEWISMISQPPAQNEKDPT